ncbi:hypothetical protein [Sphingomonas sp. 1P08PE]|uniref:hypothetical protein n=1 Tax=Sphingomonas sp. 1P08PE TaxID=554122 RepID=UPI0039A08AFA
MLTVLLIVVASATGVVLTAGVMTAVIRAITKNDALSLASGTLALPLLICGAVGYWLAVGQADDIATERILASAFLNLALVTPITFLASQTMVRFLVRRALPNSR